jgi:esterase FrsA
MGLTHPEETERAIDRLEGLDGAAWAATWVASGSAFLERARDLESTGDLESARDNYFQAYGFFFLGRFPCPNHPAKLASYRSELEAYKRFGRLAEPPITAVELPFPEGTRSDRLRFYLRRPEGVTRPPVVVMWGGVDAWKEEMTELSTSLTAIGIATIAMDNVGTGESPLSGVADGERQFLPVIEWAKENSAIDGNRMVLLCRSFGGLWATKLAHQSPASFRGAVNWGGGVHFMFQPEWVERSRHPDSYLMELVETRSRMLGATNESEYVSGFAALSLLDQGLLDQACAPLLLVNGRNDTQVPIADFDLLVEHGDPKSVRLFAGRGHMGFGPDTVPTITKWISSRLMEGEQ